VNIPLLQRLRDAGGRFVALDLLGDDPARVAADLALLEIFGFALERHPAGDVAYRGPAERLCPDQIEWELNTRRIGRRIAVWNRVTSTNDLAARASASRANEGLVILAEEQTVGRGRRGRSWSAPPRSAVLMSVLLFPPEALDRPPWLTALGAVATAQVVEHWSGRPTWIKWPNDVRVESRKIAGVLVERGAGSVLGIGLNVNAAIDDLPADLRSSATSLRILNGGRLDRSEVARSLIRQLDRAYDEGLREGPEALASSWRARLEPMGRAVRVTTATDCHEGRLIDADFRRGLTLDHDGRTRSIPAADIVLLTLLDEPPDPI
jgi:BirA family biotin operon repressor/biotin-[acetyl-CoA-carboxylase] ligase